MKSLPIYHNDDRDFSLMQTAWSSALSPLLSIPMLKGNQLKNVVLASGDNVINHKLSRKYQGYIITGMRNAYSEIYEIPSDSPNLTLILNSSASCIVDIWVW